MRPSARFWPSGRASARRGSSTPSACRAARHAGAHGRSRGAGARYPAAIGQRLHGRAAARSPSANASRFDRILVMPTAAAAPGRPPRPSRRRRSSSRRSAVARTAERRAAMSDDRPATTVVTPPRGPVFTTFQQAPRWQTGAARRRRMPAPNGAPQFVPGTRAQPHRPARLRRTARPVAPPGRRQAACHGRG